MNEKIASGRAEISIEDGIVSRPAKKSSQTVQNFLKFMCDRNIRYVPQPLGFDEKGNERVSYLAGEVYDYPLPAILMNEKSIQSAGRLLRDFHDNSIEFVKQLSGNELWMLECETSPEVICHNDYAPYNVTTSGGIATGIINFDTIGPGTRLWDVGYAAYRWVPLYFEENVTISENQLERLQFF